MAKRPPKAKTEGSRTRSSKRVTGEQDGKERETPPGGDSSGASPAGLGTSGSEHPTGSERRDELPRVQDDVPRVQDDLPRVQAASPEGLERIIRERAYFLWEHAGRPGGRDEEFWCQARDQLLREADQQKGR